MLKILTKDNWIDLLKWFLGSVVLVSITFIVDKGFKERSAGSKKCKLLTNTLK